MQPDYSKMAQQSQAAPQQQAAPQATEEQLAEASAGFEEAGMPAGTDAEGAKQRILFVLEKAGVLEKLQPQQLQQLTQKIDEFVKIAETGDMQKIQSHPIYQMLQQVVQGGGEEAAPQAAPQQPAAPTNFAGMVPPMGGGMSGS